MTAKAARLIPVGTNIPRIWPENLALTYRRPETRAVRQPAADSPRVDRDDNGVPILSRALPPG